MATSANVRLKHIFGCKKGPIQVFHTDEFKIIYPAGLSIVSYGTVDHTMDFFAALEASKEITCFTISPLRRYAAVATRSERALIVIYDNQTLRRKKTLTCPQVVSDVVTSIAFAPGKEMQYILTMGGEPDHKLVLWDWEVPKAMQIIDVGAAVSTISYNTIDYTLGMYCTGPDCYRKYMLYGTTIDTPIETLACKDRGEDMITHGWTQSGVMVVATTKGRLLVLDPDAELLYTLQSQVDIICMHMYSKGLVLGGRNAAIEVFELDSESNFSYAMSTNLQKPMENVSIQSVSLNPLVENQLIVATDSSQLLTAAFFPDTPSQSTLNFELLNHEYHNGPITGLDICVRKSLIATCGHDGTIKIWNVLDKKLEVSEWFGEPLQSIAFHPSGFHLLVGMSDKLRMMNVFSSTIEWYKDIPIKMCREVRFSHGGHFFAAANGHVVSIYNYYTGENPAHLNFKGHSLRIKRINWLKDDTGLVSMAIDGSIFEWRLGSKMQEAPQIQEYQEKGVNFSDIAVIRTADKTNRTIFTIGDDQTLKEIEESGVTEKLGIGVNAAQICITNAKKQLFLGISDCPGSVRAYNFPITGDYFDFQAHEIGIERMCISHDDAFLYTAGSDGCICMFDIRGQSAAALRAARDSNALPLSEEIIITKAYLEDLHTEIDTLSVKFNDQQNELKLELERAVQEKDDYIEKKKEEIAQQAQDNKRHYDDQSDANQVREKELDYERKQKEEQFEIEKTEVDSKFQQQVMARVEKYDTLKLEKDKEYETYTEMISKIRADNAAIIAEKRSLAEALVDEEDHDKEQAESKKRDEEAKSGEIKRQIDANNSKQAGKIAECHDVELTDVKSKISQRKGKFSIMKKKYEVLQNEIESNESEKKILEEAKKVNVKHIERMKDEKDKLKEENNQRDVTIGTKEHRIYDLKKRNQELEKFKFVLDFKIKELKRDVVPREEEIAKLKDQNSEMDEELQKLNSHNENLGVVIDDLRLRQEAMQAESKVQRGQLRELAFAIGNFKDGIYDAVQVIQNPRLLKTTMLTLFNDHVKIDGSRRGGEDSGMHKEYAKQKGYLKKGVIGLKDNFSAAANVHQSHNSTMIADNVSLIAEINKLREVHHSLAPYRRQAEMQLNSSMGSSPSSMRQSPERFTHSPDPKLREIKSQRDEIKSLRLKIKQMEVSGATPTKVPGKKLEPLAPIDSKVAK